MTPTVLDPVASGGRVFCSYTHRHRDLVEPLVRKLRAHGVDVWFDGRDIAPGDQFLARMEQGIRQAAACLVCVGAGEMGEAARLELDAATVRQLSEPAFRIVPVLLPGLPLSLSSTDLPSLTLARHSWVDFRDGIVDPVPLERLARILKGLDSTADEADADDAGVCPYRGLRPFDEEHSVFYFGRDKERDEAVADLVGFPFLAILGPSGAGKSSLAVAGVASRLAVATDDGGVWRTVVVRPGAEPLFELAAALSELPGMPTAREMAVELQDRRPEVRAKTLALLIRRCLRAHQSPAGITLVVDQLEQVYTLCADDAQRTMFLDQLTHACVVDPQWFRVLVTMRTDFYSRVASHGPLATLMADHHILLTALDDERLGEVITKPAAAAGLEFQAGLVETIIADVRGQPAALPLLEHALFETWQARQSRRLTLAGHLSSGGVRAAVAARAEDVVHRLSDHDPATLDAIRAMFTRLTRIGDDSEGTAQPQLMSTLSVGRETDPVELVVDAFAAARLITVRATLDGPKTVEVAHEALIRSWPRLRSWIDDDRAALLALQRLADAARLWQSSGGDPSYLYRGSLLAQARALQHAGSRLGLDETAFVEAAGLAEHADATEQARSRLARRSAMALAVATALVAAGLAVAVMQWRNTSAARTRARSYQLAAESRRNVGAAHDLALILAVESVRTEDNPVTRAALLDVLAAPGAPSRFLPTPAGRVGKAAINNAGVVAVDRTDDGERLLLLTGERRDIATTVDLVDIGAVALAQNAPVGVVGSGSDIVLVDLMTRTTRPLGAADARVTAVAVSPDGKHIIAGTESGRARTPVADPSVHDVDLGEPITSIAVTNDGSLVIGGRDGSLTWAPAGTTDPLHITTGSSDAIVAIAFDATRQWAYAATAGRITVWDVVTGRARADWTGLGAIVSLSLAPQGTVVSALLSDGPVATFDTATGREPAPRRRAEQPKGAQGSGHPAAIDRTDNGLEALTDDGRIVWWDATPARPVATPASPPAAAADGSKSCTSPNGFTVRTGDTGALLTRAGDRDGSLLSSVPTTAVACSQVGTRFAVANGNDVLLWLAPGATPLTLHGHHDPVDTIAFAPDGRRLVTGADDRTVIEWDAPSGTLLRRLTAQTDNITALAYSPDGRQLASASEDGTTAVWNVASGSTIAAPLVVDGSPVTTVVYEPDGRLVTTTRNGTTLRWELSPARWLALACAAAHRTLTADERASLGLQTATPCQT